MSKKICAVDIKKLWHGAVLPAPANYAEGGSLAASIKSWLGLATTKEIKNIHQDTWTLEEDDPSQESYKNQLTGRVYRQGRKEMGDVKINFTIGKYDYELKKEFLGGTLIKDGTGENAEVVGWHRSADGEEISKAFLALTVDDQYCFFPCASVMGSEKDTDKAVGVGVVATATEHPESEALPIECWYDKSAVDNAVVG